MKNIYKINLFFTVFIPFFAQAERSFYIHNQYKDPIYVKVNNTEFKTNIPTNQHIKIPVQISDIQYLGIKTKGMFKYQPLDNDLQRLKDEAAQPSNNTKTCHLTILPTTNIFKFKDNNLIEWVTSAEQSLKEQIEEAAQKKYISAQQLMHFIEKEQFYGKTTSMQLTFIKRAIIGTKLDPYQILIKKIEDIQNGTFSKDSSFREKIETAITNIYDVLIFRRVYRSEFIEFQGLDEINDQTRQKWINILKQFASPSAKQQYNNYITRSTSQ